jgi:hypothetical protein
MTGLLDAMFDVSLRAGSETTLVRGRRFTTMSRQPARAEKSQLARAGTERVDAREW